VSEISPLLAASRFDDRGGIIAAVAAGSPGERAGVMPGDRVVAIDGLVPRDVIDVQSQTQGRRFVTIDVVRDGRIRTLRAHVDRDSELGLDFEQPTFDGLRQCNNNCEFCFIRGLPKGLRRSLYVRDDDYRYSFLYGSFVTLTNLSDDDWRRIGFQRLSPLRVSIHATEPDVRAHLLAHPGADPILPQLRGFGEVGIKVHAQIVLCPGLNDGEVLERTIRDLVEVAHVVESVAVVPVGISDHLRVREIRPVRPDEAGAVLRSLLRWNRKLRREIGRGFVYPSDEFFLMAGHRLPGAAFYDGYPQLQNGVGLTRVMLADWRRQRRRLPASISRPRRVAWLCGVAAEPALREMAAEANRVEKLSVEVHAVRNTLFGSAIGVSGLMSGKDVASALDGLDVDRAVLPRTAFGYEGERTLDEWTVEMLEQRSGVRVYLGRTAGDLVNLTVN
jgi:putative radical SAM enzyme (TIGR03279 family)